MRCLRYFLLLGWACAPLLSSAQLARFSKLPAPYQLYPRTSSSVAHIPIAGRLMLLGYNRMSMQIFRNTTLYRYTRQPIVYAGTTAPFSLTATIPAELAQYRIRVFVHQTGSTDSVQIMDRQNIVAGDVFVINGQSNASAYGAPPAYTHQSEYIRTFGVMASNTNFGPYDPADTLWAPGNQSGATLVGTWGMEIARRIIEMYGIPVCILNGAAGGAGIEYLSIRNETNPQDLTTNHGRLLYRVRKAGLTGAVKAYFFRQGENEANGNAPAWPGEFEKLYQNVRLDYPNLARFYLFQIHLLSGPNPATAVFRDYQRRAGRLLPLVQTHATVGTRGYDGIHFNVAGHVQTGAEVFRLVARDFYSSADTNQISSPNIQKIYYLTPAQNEVVVQFDEGQRMVWPNDTTVADAYGAAISIRPQQWLYLNKLSGRVVSGRAEGNRIILTLNGSYTDQKLAYLPPNYPQTDGAGNPLPGEARAFPGPFLKNRRGLRAFSFWDVPVAAPLASLSGLTASVLSGTAIQLAWADHPAEQWYMIERKRSFDETFVLLAQLPANTTSFLDPATTHAVTYQYRLRAVTPTAETTADASATILCPKTNQVSSAQSGDWQQPLTWNCLRVPNLIERVRISPSHVVTLNQTVTIKSLVMQGNVRFGPRGNLRFIP